MSSKIQTEIANAAKERKSLELMEQAMQRVRKKESDNKHRYITIPNGLSHLKLLCKVDKEGNILPSERKRISIIKKELGIK